MINVAIDGPAGAGKSTVAKAVAKEFGIIYLDTGAMYRATAYYALQKGAEVTDETAVKALLDDMKMEIVFENGAQQIYVNGINTTPFLREHYMSKAASDISALPPVRYKMVELQREFAAKTDVVLDGRDIGTFVLPNANCKIYMTASPEERASRRYKELKEKGQDVDYDTLLADINKRDYNDSHREVAPLRQADDAELLDTTNMSVEEVVKFVSNVVRQKTGVSAAEQPSGKDGNAPDNSAGKSANSDGETRASLNDEKNAIGNIAEKSGEKAGNNVEAAKPTKEDNPDKKASKNVDKSKKFYKLQTHFGLYRFLRVILHPIQALLWPTKIVNKENGLKIENNAVYICNHYSKVDTFIPCFALFKREAHILAKHELFENPVSGWFLYKMGAIPVKRGEADIDAVKCVLKVLKDGKKLMMFPEGTRNKKGTQEMAEFKSGAARFAVKTKSPIVPMLYYSSPKLFRKNWLYIGEPFTVEEFYGARTQEDWHKATELIRRKMDETRELLNAYVEALKDKRKKK